MKVLANFNLNNNDHLNDLVIYPPHSQPNKIYHVIAIENNDYRVIGDNLDNQLVSPAFFEVLDYEFVSDWQAQITNDNFNFMPKIFAQFSYFWEDLHEGNKKNSLQYADIYMAYLAKLLGKNTLCQTLENLYLQTLNNNRQNFSFWQKQWLKHVFNVENTVEIRQSIPNFQHTISRYLENLT